MFIDKTYPCLFFLLFCFFEYSSAQKVVKPMFPYPKNTDSMIVIDSVNIRILYALNAVELNNPKTYDDLQRLEIGTKFSKYYSYYIFNSDSLATEWTKKHPKAQSALLRHGVHGKFDGWSEYHYSEFFKDLSKNTLTEYARMPMYLQKDNSKYTESYLPQDWKIYNDTQTISGYLCQKATCKFRGRNYTAWFTRKFPLNYGPWKFGGLPGLILKIYDDDKLYTFECVAIQTLQKKIPMLKYKDYENYNKRNRKDLLTIQRMIHEDYLKITGAKDYKTKKPLSTPSVYHPIEIE